MKNRKGIATHIGTGLVGFMVGAVFMAPGTEDANKVEQYDIISKECIELRKELEVSNERLEEAKPYFEFTSEEKKALEQETAKKEQERLIKEKEEQEKKKQEDIEKSKITLESGNHIAGTDFDAGVYTIVAVKGNGNVYSDNLYKGGINALMGVNDNGFHLKEYKNIKLPKGTTLTLDRVTVELIPVR